jgi:LmbE family N-acetylglucosaminyl deacetylase
MNVLAVVAHPDDELMAAGTLARLVDAGHDVTVCICFDYEQRADEAAIATKIIGANPLLVLSPDEDDYRLSIGTVTAADQLLNDVDLLITHRMTDTNQSHHELARVMRAACRRNDCSVWTMDQAMPGGLDPTAPRPNHYVDISTQRHTKRRAVEAYASQTARYPGWLEAIEARDSLYGWQIGVEAAEGFIIEKSLWL